MTSKILDGRALAAQLKQDLMADVRQMQKDYGVVPHLVNVIVGTDPGSCAYAGAQKRVAEQIGLRYDLLTLPDDVSQNDFVDTIGSLNRDAGVHGIMIHKPLPKTLDYQAAANVLDVQKDLEGINVINIGKILLGSSQLIPCTPAAVMEHLRSTGMSLRGREAVIVGASEIVGKPLSLLLLREMATVTVCHIATTEAGHLDDHVRRADILVVAVGKAGLIKGDLIKPGAVVIDVGINRVGENIVGDVCFATAAEKAAWITPVPGGVGPVTVVMLMRNGVEAARTQLSAQAVG